jgi:hypothetical protein
MVNYFLTVQDFTPDLVLLHEIVNDAEPRAWPKFSRDYSHYRHPWTPPRYVWPLRTLVGWSDLVAFLDLRRTSNAGLERLVTTDPKHLMAGLDLRAFGYACTQHVAIEKATHVMITRRS